MYKKNNKNLYLLNIYIVNKIWSQTSIIYKLNPILFHQRLKHKNNWLKNISMICINNLLYYHLIRKFIKKKKKYGNLDLSFRNLKKRKLIKQYKLKMTYLQRIKNMIFGNMVIKMMMMKLQTMLVVYFENLFFYIYFVLNSKRIYH